jgi:predicted RNA-binding Zn-ribbon protein involved in translation (DUF1610 family)
MKKISFAFWLNPNKIDEQQLIQFLQAQDNIAQYMKETLDKVRKLELVSPLTEDLKLEKLKVDIEFKKVCTAIKEKELLHWNTFDKTPSYQAKKAITKAEKNRDLETVQVSAYDEKNNRFMCPECGNCFVFSEDQRDIAESKEQFIDHYFQKHGEIPKSLEHELRELS